MTTEFALLLGLSVFILAGSFLNKNSGVEATFKKAGPKLGARIERHIETGAGWEVRWEEPPRNKQDQR